MTHFPYSIDLKTIQNIFKGANLDIIDLSSNERLAAWSFCSSTQEPETEITCLVPFSSDPASKNTSHVLVGLDTGLHGLLAVFDITGNIAFHLI